MSRSRLFAILGLIVMGVLSRLIPHPPNFTAINTIALFGALHLGNIGFSFVAVFLSLFLSDLVFGFHSTLFVVYLSFGLITLLGFQLKNKMFGYRLPLYCVAGSLLFFVLVNFGVWLSTDFYPKTIEGLELCYVAAIPFLMNQIIGDLSYAALLWGGLALYRNGLKLCGNRDNEASLSHITASLQQRVRSNR